MNNNNNTTRNQALTVASMSMRQQQKPTTTTTTTTAKAISIYRNSLIDVRADSDMCVALAKLMMGRWALVYIYINVHRRCALNTSEVFESITIK